MATVEWVREFLNYNPETGDIIWKKRPSNRVQVGAEVGCVSHTTNGYRLIGIKGRVYIGSRIVWLYMTGEWPSKQIDHINGNRADDRWANLRLAEHRENQANRGKQTNNTSGFKGVHFHKQTGKWRARMKFDGRFISLGLHETPELAYLAYCQANTNLNGVFARN